MRLLLFSIVFLLLCTHAFCQPRYITFDNSKIWVNTIGVENREAGQPVIVFENGHGVPMGNWDKVLPGASNLAPVVTYDRPGIGQSEAVDEMPTLKNVADRLVTILEQLDLPPPYLLVGHSLGGLYVRGFPIYHPELLAGLVIVDPADFTENHQNKRRYYDDLGWEESRVDSLIQTFIDRRVERNAKSPLPIGREGQVLEKIRDEEFQIISENPLPSIPVHIIAGGRFNLPKNLRSKAYDEEAVFRSKMNHRIIRWTEVVNSVDKGMFFYSANSGHYVQWDDPELVLASIKIALEAYEESKKK